MFPVTRLPVQVHDSDNIDSVVHLCIDNAVRETTNQAPSQLPFDGRPCLGVLDDHFNGGDDLSGKGSAQTTFAVLVVLASGDKLFFCFGVKIVAHRLTCLPV